MDWAKKWVNLPHSARKVKFDAALTPYLIEPANALLNNHVQEITCLGAVQSAKSTIAEIFACHIIAEDPGPLMWNFQSDGDAKEAAETRINPMFEACKPVIERLPAGNKRKTMFCTLADMFYIIQGANARSNLQSKSIRYVINDESWLYPPGHLAEANKRTTAYEFNRRVLNLSTGAVLDDDTDTAFKAGTCHMYGFTCSKCGVWHAGEWGDPKEPGGMRWDDNSLTRDKDGDWVIEEVLKTVRYECFTPGCGMKWFDNPKSRRELLALCSYEAANPNPQPGCRSYWWASMFVPWIRWSTLVYEWLKALQMVKMGQLQPLQEFMQKRLAKSWERRTPEDKVTVPTADYDFGTGLENRKRRLQTVDVQDNHFWVVVRDWTSYGASRLVWCGRLDLWPDVRNKQLEFGVVDSCVLVDASWGQGQTGPRTVYYACCMYGWTALMGDDREMFSIPIGDGRSKLSLLGEPQRGDPLVGKHMGEKERKDLKTRSCPVIRWSNPSVKDILENLSRGRGALWEIPRETPPEWFAHMRAEVKRISRHPDTGQKIVKYILVGKKQNHLRDCELMQIVGAVLGGMLGDEKMDSPLPVEEGAEILVSSSK